MLLEGRLPPECRALASIDRPACNRQKIGIVEQFPVRGEYPGR
jgi:hypothetical protein